MITFVSKGNAKFADSSISTWKIILMHPKLTIHVNAKYSYTVNCITLC